MSSSSIPTWTKELLRETVVNRYTRRAFTPNFYDLSIRDHVDFMLSEEKYFAENPDDAKLARCLARDIRQYPEGERKEARKRFLSDLNNWDTCPRCFRVIPSSSVEVKHYTHECTLID